MAPRMVVALVLGLAVLAGLGVGGAPISLPFRDGTPDRLDIVANLLVLAGLGLLVTALAVFVARGGYRSASPGAPPFRVALVHALPTAAVAVAMAGLLLISRADLGSETDVEGRPQRVADAPDRRGLPLNIRGWWDSYVRAGEGADEAPGSRAETDPDQAVLLMVAVLAATALAGVAVWRWRTGGLTAAEPDPVDGERERQALRGAVAGTIDAMLADPDPGTAIRGAYARLLEGLAEGGSGRMDHEGPMEHLERVLRTLDVRPGPLRQLIGLFELARFSTLPLTPSHREAALVALRSVAADMAGSSWRGAGFA
jgi:hypothetical protein